MNQVWLLEAGVYGYDERQLEGYGVLAVYADEKMANAEMKRLKDGGYYRTAMRVRPMKFVPEEWRLD